MEKIIFIVVMLVSLSSVAFAAINVTDFSINDIKSNLPEGVTLPTELENLNIPSVENITKVLREKCIKESGSDAAYEEANQATTVLMECIQELVDFSNIEEEIETAKPTGNVDAVFNKYCDKRGEAIQCVEKFTLSLDPCLTKEEKDQKVVFVNITKSLLEFVCHENGNQIALFIAEEGPECFRAKQDHIHECVNKTLGKYSNDGVPSVDDIPNLIIKEENCRDMDKLEECVVKELEQCKESTPANLVEALFRFVRKETPCKQFPKVLPNATRNSGNSNKMTLEFIIGTWIMAFVAKFILKSQ